jgi:hypothetical protein
MMITVPSLAAFYEDNSDRRFSGEADYGVHWRHDGKPWPLYRVAYVHATGEVYAVQQGNGNRELIVLGVVQPDPDARTETGDWASGETYYRTLDWLLEGWEDHAVSGHDLAWVQARLAGAQDRRA